jgi:protein-S-isoprenylcysteine O-methyltransferase Ste14
MNPQVFTWIIYAIWLLVVVYLTVSVIGVKRDTETHLGQSLGLLFALLAAFLLPRLSVFSFVNFTPVSPELSIVGIVLCLVGFAILMSARRTLGKNWSQTVATKEDHELITSGLYRYVRHPMYAGGFIAAIGSAITAGGAFVFLLLLLTPLFIWRTGAEDKLMAQQFPNEFPAYKRMTKKLIPFVW